MKCACGCGKKLKEPKYPSWQKRFIHNHHHKGFQSGENIPCQICGKKIYRAPWQLKRSKTHTCSTKCHGKLVSIKHTGKGHPNWKGGRVKTTQGYISIYVGKRKYITEHRLVAQEILKRPLRKNEIPHHKNENKQDNRKENIEITTRANHPRIHKPRLHKRLATPIPLPL